MRRLLYVLIVCLAASLLVGPSIYAKQTTHLPAATGGTDGLSTGVSVSTKLSHQGFIGNATIEYVAPVCSLTGSVPASGPALAITSANGVAVAVPLDWTLINNCILFAPIHVNLNPGTYLVTLSPCFYSGCKLLPLTVNVVPGVFTPVVIKVITGIV